MNKMNGNRLATEVRQGQILAFLRHYQKHNNRPPTYREIAKEMGFSNTNAVAYHLDKLEESGKIRRMPNSRGIRLLEPKTKKRRT